MYENNKYFFSLAPVQFGLAGAIVAGIFYSLFALFAYVEPEMVAKLFSNFHFVAVAPAQVTFGGYLMGLLHVFVLVFVVKAFFAWLYNRFLCRTYCKAEYE